MQKTYTADDLARAEARAARLRRQAENAGMRFSFHPNPRSRADMEQRDALSQAARDTVDAIRTSIAQHGAQTAFDTRDPFAPTQLSF